MVGAIKLLEIPAIMLALETDPALPAVATTQLPAPRVRAKFQPIAGLAPHPSPSAMTPSAPLPMTQPSAPSVVPEAAPPAAIKTTVFAAEQRPHSPWTAPKAPLTSPFGVASPKLELGRPAPVAEADEGIEGVRKLIFGRHMTEVQTKVAELQMALSGEMKRLREALMGRVDEMAGYLHRDMVILREETQREISQLKTDLFTAATTLSGIRDRLTTVEAKAVEGVRESLTELDGRLLRQETAFAAALENLETNFHRTIDSKCAEALGVLAKKSDVADMLQKMGTLIEQTVDETPAAQVSAPVTAPPQKEVVATSELGWFAAPPSAPLPPPSAVWPSLAKVNANGTVADWSAGDGNPFPHSLIA